MKTATFLTIFLLFAGTAYGQDCYGRFYIYNIADGAENPLSLYCHILRDFGDYSDGIDGVDGIMNFDEWIYDSFVSANSRIGQFVPYTHLWQDARAVDDSSDVILIDLFINDGGGKSYLNVILIDGFYDMEDWYGCKAFGDYLVFLYSERFLYGQFVNLRKLIDNFNPYNSPDYGYPHIHCQNITASTARFPIAYDTLKLYIAPNNRYYYDFDGNGILDNGDFSVFAADWLNEGLGLRMDISGQDGLPDGKVDYYDLIELAEGWMSE
jgi:hypothetical protein